MKTKTVKQTITKKYLEFKDFDDFKRNIDIRELIKKNDEWIKDIYNSYVDVEDTLINCFARLKKNWNVEYSDFNYELNPLNPSNDELFITPHSLRRAVHDEEDDLFLPPHIGFYVSYNEEKHINIEHILLYNDHVDAVLYKRLEDFMLEYERALKEWIHIFYESYDYINIILDEIWFRIELGEIKIKEGWEVERKK